MRLIDGQKISEEILARLKRKINGLTVKPCLAVLAAGSDPASRLYLRLKKKAARKIGMNVKERLLPAKATASVILRIIKSWNDDENVHGILIQFPLPAHMDSARIVQAINPGKDVDGFSSDSKFDPPFVLAVWTALQTTHVNLRSKKAAALVRSDVLGRALADFFRERGLTLQHSTDRAHDLNLLKKADIIITALGQPKYLTEEMIQSNTILIDGGITRQDGQAAGDVDTGSVKERAAWLAPVPGGVGPITVAMLLKNVVLAAGH